LNIKEKESDGPSGRRWGCGFPEEIDEKGKKE